MQHSRQWHQTICVPFETLSDVEDMSAKTQVATWGVTCRKVEEDEAGAELEAEEGEFSS